MAGSSVKKPADNKLSGRIWFNLCLFGFTGQIAWNLENMYYNTFMYNTVYEGGTVTGTLSSMSAIKLMVALSAVAAVVTTFIMGNLSDKMNKRKVFISVGYILWGIVTAAFGFITKDNIAGIFGLSDTAKIVTATAVTIIVMDCIMTFMGSTSNDSAFNAWVTDVTTVKNRATAESVLAILPVAALLIVVVLGGMIETLGGGDIAKGYRNFFFMLGGFVIVCGIIGLFTLKDSLNGEKKANANYWKDLFYGFKPSVIKENSKLYIALAAVGIFNIAVQIFFPYLLIYLGNLGLNVEDLLGIVLSNKVILAIVPVALIVLVVAIIALGKIVDKIGKNVLVFVALVLFVIGGVAASFMNTLGSFVVAALPLLIGYGALGIMLNATVRDYTPEDKVGLFQGVRMIFMVLLPMVIGPAIGDFVCKTAASGTYVGDDGLVNYSPCAEMFLAAGILGAFVIIPLLALKKKGIDKKEN